MIQAARHRHPAPGASQYGRGGGGDRRGVTAPGLGERSHRYSKAPARGRGAGRPKSSPSPPPPAPPLTPAPPPAPAARDAASPGGQAAPGTGERRRRGGTGPGAAGGRGGVVTMAHGGGGEELCPSALLFQLNPPFGPFPGEQPEPGSGRSPRDLQPKEPPRDAGGYGPGPGRGPGPDATGGLRGLAPLLHLGHGPPAPDSPSISISTPFSAIPDLLADPGSGHPRALAPFGVDHHFAPPGGTQSSDDSGVPVGHALQLGGERWSLESTQRFGLPLPGDAGNVALGPDGDLSLLHLARTQAAPAPRARPEHPLNGGPPGAYTAARAPDSEHLSCSTAGEHPLHAEHKPRARGLDVLAGDTELRRGRPDKQPRHCKVPHA